MSGLAARLRDLASGLPHKEAVRYDRQSNLKMSLHELMVYSDALASGLMETGLKPKDTVLAWIPKESAEFHTLQLAAAKAGLVVASVPVELTDHEAIREIIKDSGAASIFVPQDLLGLETDYVALMRKALPELYSYMRFKKVEKLTLEWQKEDGFIQPYYRAHKEETTRTSQGQTMPPGFSKIAPNLILPVHTGVDNIQGFYKYKHLFAFNSDTQMIFEGTKDLDGKVTPKGGDKKLPADCVLVRGSTEYRVVRNDNFDQAKLEKKKAEIIDMRNAGVEVDFETIEELYSLDDDHLVPKIWEHDSVYKASDKDLVYIEYGMDGKAKGKPLSQKDVEAKSEDWEVVRAILAKEYIEVL